MQKQCSVTLDRAKRPETWAPKQELFYFFFEEVKIVLQQSLELKVKTLYLCVFYYLVGIETTENLSWKTRVYAYDKKILCHTHTHKNRESVFCQLKVYKVSLHSILLIQNYLALVRISQFGHEYTSKCEFLLQRVQILNAENFHHG